MPKITKIGGAILLLTGIAILTGQLQILGFFILEYFPFIRKYWLVIYLLPTASFIFFKPSSFKICINSFLISFAV